MIVSQIVSFRAMSLGAETWPSSPHQFLPALSLAAVAVRFSSRSAASTDAASLALHLVGERLLVGCSGTVCGGLVEGCSKWSEAMSCCWSSSFPSIFSRRWLMARSSLVCSFSPSASLCRPPKTGWSTVFSSVFSFSPPDSPETTCAS